MKLTLKNAVNRSTGRLKTVHEWFLIDYFKTVNRWRRRNGLPAYTSFKLHAHRRNGAIVIFGFKEKRK